ncbi:MAG: response regulator transcription factor [Alkaliphilus sp.]
MRHIFVIDDEIKIRDLIKLYLVKENYQVTLFEDGSNVVKEMQRLKPDLLVLDIMMPNVNGLELCKQIRKNSEIPIIFVSAKDEEFDRVLGLELGADDYLSKPFSPRELMVRIKNIFKRIDKTTLPSEIFELHDIVVNVTDRTTKKGSKELNLTTKEFDLFSFLVQNKNQPYTREQLLSRVWGYDYFGDERTIDDLVKRIRKKLAGIDSKIEIRTVWGYGYKVVE